MDEEGTSSRYLHKKFKKQLSIEPPILPPPPSLITWTNNNNNNNNNHIIIVDQNVPTTTIQQQTSTNNNSVLNNYTTATAAAAAKSSISSSSLLVHDNPLDGFNNDNNISYATTSTTSSILKLGNHNEANIQLVEKSVLPTSTTSTASNNATSVAAASAASSTGGGGKYVCTYCNLACSKPSVLQKHIRAHTNERPYPCLSCGFSFKTRSNLYKHCRSRTHANRVLGNNKEQIQQQQQAVVAPIVGQQRQQQLNNTAAGHNEIQRCKEDNLLLLKTKPYKPRFHNAATQQQQLNDVDVIQEDAASVFEEEEQRRADDDVLEDATTNELKRRLSLNDLDDLSVDLSIADNIEPLNLTNKNRKRCLSEVTPTTPPPLQLAETLSQKSLIKELLLKNLYADSNNLQCAVCKMQFQTVTEMELHKMRSSTCNKTNTEPISPPAAARFRRCTSVNVATILTQHKTEHSQQPQNGGMMMMIKSPGPFLGKTRLIDSALCDDHLLTNSYSMLPTSTTTNITDRRKANNNVKLFGGEVKITTTNRQTGEQKSYKIDGTKKERNSSNSAPSIVSSVSLGKLSENCVIKSTLHSGGTVLQSDTNRLATTPSSVHKGDELLENGRYSRNLMDFSQNAAKLLVPNLKQLNLTIPGVPIPPLPPSSTSRFMDASSSSLLSIKQESNNNVNPMNLFVNGKVVRYVPGIPGPVIAEHETIMERPNILITPVTPPPPPVIQPLATTTTATPSIVAPTQKQCNNKEQQQQVNLESLVSSPSKTIESVIVGGGVGGGNGRKFARPNSLALKPSTMATTLALKQHHGLTPTMFNQILISPDTPRIAKKCNEHFLHGNYFSYLGLKCSTKPVYCTLNKTQPFYVPHFKKLSMYSEWRQQDNKSDKLYVSAYDSRQMARAYTLAGCRQTHVDYIVHSSYKFNTSSEIVTSAAAAAGAAKEESLTKCGNSSSFSLHTGGGYDSNDESTYVRGRGRGRFVCEQCGIRCRKPSMLKKHIRTHSNVRPYTCKHCNFSFKTKGNLTKHLKSKAHTKNYAASNGSSNSNSYELLLQQSGGGTASSSASETEDSGMDSSDESSTRHQEHEAAYGLLSLSTQKPTHTNQQLQLTSTSLLSPLSVIQHASTAADTTTQQQLPLNFIKTEEELVHVSKSIYARNKFMEDDEEQQQQQQRRTHNEFGSNGGVGCDRGTTRKRYLGSTDRPLTYPYTSISSISDEVPLLTTTTTTTTAITTTSTTLTTLKEDEPKNIIHFNVIKRYNTQLTDKIIDAPIQPIQQQQPQAKQEEYKEKVFPLSDENSIMRKRKLSTLMLNDDMQPTLQPPPCHVNNETSSVAMDLSIEKSHHQHHLSNNKVDAMNKYNTTRSHNEENFIPTQQQQQQQQQQHNKQRLKSYNNNRNNVITITNSNYIVIGGAPSITSNVAVTTTTMTTTTTTTTLNKVKLNEYDNSAMETLADIATKQEKLDKNSIAKNVASEFLKLATKHDYHSNNIEDNKSFVVAKDVNDLVAKSEENKSCTICMKNFNKPSQLRLHMNIHYLERPFRCETCSVSFRTKGHLQKHERSASHHNKLSSSPALASSEPRPFKCTDCSIAFRIHGHLAKHLRSKMHIMKLECLAKIPFGLYAELERSNSLLTEINTADGEQCLQSLKMLAKKVFLNDPNKLTQFDCKEKIEQQQQQQIVVENVSGDS